MFSVFQSILQNISINELTNCRDITEIKEFLQKFGYTLNFEELEAFKAFLNSPKQQGDNLNSLSLSELYNVAGGLKGLIIHTYGKIEFFNNPNASFSPNTIIFRDQLNYMHTLSKLRAPNKYDTELNKDGFFRFSMFGRRIFDFDSNGDGKQQLKIHAKSFNYEYPLFDASNQFFLAVKELPEASEAQSQVPESQFHINVVESAADQKQLGILNLSELSLKRYSRTNDPFLQLSLKNGAGLSFDLTEAQAQKHYGKLSELSITKNLELILDGKAIKGKFSVDGNNGQNYHYLTSPSEETLHHYFGGEFLVLQQHTGECAHPIETDYYHANMHDMKGVLEILKNIPKGEVFKVLPGLISSGITKEQIHQIYDFVKENYNIFSSTNFFKDHLAKLSEADKKAFETLNAQKNLYIGTIVVSLLASIIVAGLSTDYALGDPLDL